MSQEVLTRSKAKKSKKSTPRPPRKEGEGWLSRVLNRVERIGNRLPDPLTLFVILSVLIIVSSWLLATLGVSVTHPADGRVIQADSLLRSENIRRMFTEMVKNFAAFPPLGLVLVTMIGIGVAERTGLITAALRQLVNSVPKSALTATLVFGGIMSSMAADAGYVVLTPLGAMLFAGLGRHPIAGLAAAFAGVSGGFSANLLLTSLDPLLSGISTTSAQIFDKAYVVQPSANYYFMLASVVVITIVGTLVTDRIVEPRLGKWKPRSTPGQEGPSQEGLGKLTKVEKRGLLAAAATFILSGVGVALLVIPEGAPLRDAEHGLKPFYESLVTIIMLVFFLAGAAYGIVTRTIRSDKDVARMTSDTMATMGGYIVLAFVAAQFVAYFSWSNMGIIFAVSGANALQGVGLSGIPLVIGFIIVAAGINIFIGSASAKWAIMGPVFIPMLMMMGYSPELVQAAYRVGDSVTNIITPLLPYFPIIIAFARKYEPDTGIGTLISTMLPYSIAFAVVWTLMLIVWIGFGIPLGPEAPLDYVLPAGAGAGAGASQ